MSDSVNIKRGDIVASVLRQYLSAFLADGWVEIIAKSDDHADKILSFSEKDELEKYVKDNFNVDLDKRGSLDTMKEKALAIIESK